MAGAQVGECRLGIAAQTVLLLAALAMSAVFPSPARAHDPQDQVLEQVGVDERLGARLPEGLAFRDQNGRAVLLDDYFTGMPVIVTLNYFACPTLCPLVFRNLAGTVGRLGGLTLGKDFRIVTVSIDPEESPTLAREKSTGTYAMLGSAPDPASNWPFLMGNRDSIGSLAQAVGVRYQRLGNRDFAHPNVLVVVTGERRVSRYLYGLEQQPRDLKLALIEASGGRIGASNTDICTRNGA